ncbi:MAG TPA: hypothetical protein VK581_01260, partial [Chthoniobacterales bacterium]|nr:hypothetical protein [Chthoniobacterales bacterium]
MSGHVVREARRPLRTPSARGEPSARPFWILAALFAVCLLGAADWFTAGTLRLYLDEDSVANRQEGNVWQHFGVRGDEVVPEIISDNEA